MQHIEANDNAALIAWLDKIIMGVVHEGMDIMMAESIYLVHHSLQQFLVMATDKDNPLQLQGITIRRLLRRALSSLSIPFHGEPAEGLQVMGRVPGPCDGDQVHRTPFGPHGPEPVQQTRFRSLSQDQLGMERIVHMWQ